MSANISEEKEIAIYAKMMFPEELNKADGKIEILQAEIKDSKRGKVRVRKTTDEDGSVYTITVKEKHESNEETLVVSNTEITEEITPELFDAFYNVANRKQNKVRYHFVKKEVSLNLHDDVLKSIQLPEIIYEVDVFNKQDGTHSEWVKIDIEVDKLMAYLEQNYPEIKKYNLKLSVSNLPFEATNAFIGENATPEQKEILENLYVNEFNY